MRDLTRASLVVFASFSLLAFPALAGSWQPLLHQPSFAASTMFLLTDGTVLCQVDADKRWWKLTPDINGSYVNGTWSKLANSKHDCLYYASGVFADGRVIIAGGEYSSSGSETNKTEIYDPVANVWTEISPPSGWSNIGDAPCAVLADGRFYLGQIFDNRTALYDPVAGAWTAGPTKQDSLGTEETWALLPDGTVVTPECYLHPKSEKYVPSLNQWVSTGDVPVDLVEAASLEIGPGMAMADGRTFFMGATPRCALYNMPANPGDPGTWTVGPTPPLINGKTIGAKDAPGALLPNGHLLLALGPVDGIGGDFLPPTYFFEFDGSALIRVADPANSGDVPYVGRMMLLPTGELLFASGTTSVYAYTCDGGPDPAWQPTITSVATTLHRSTDYTLEGTQLNGLSQAVGYGDEAGVATNYPLVRLRNQASGHVFYCRTHDHSTMAIATGSAIVTTHFLVPAAVETGLADLEVVANGIPSDPLTVIVTDVTLVSPSAVKIFRGTHLGGGLPEILSSDDQYLAVERQRSPPVVAPIQIVVEATSPSAQPTGIDLTVEAGVSAVAIDQSIEMFNWVANAYEVVDLRAASIADAEVTITPSGSLSRFVNQTTRKMKSRLTYRDAQFLRLAPWDARVDHVVWVITS
ncbi:MAG: kelch repeat-containing protein [Planctomycetota bacterium]